MPTMRTMHSVAISLTETQTAELERALRSERRVRRWQRYRAIWLLARNQSVQDLAQSLGCCPTSVYNWVQRWRDNGLAGLAEAHHAGRTRKFDEAGEDLLDSLLSRDPQQYGFHSTGWTAEVLHSQVQQAGYSVSEHTIRRTLHKLGWRWKRPKYVLGRPDPDYEQKRG